MENARTGKYREIENRLVVAQDWQCVVGKGVAESEKSG